MSIEPEYIPTLTVCHNETGGAIATFEGSTIPLWDSCPDRGGIDEEARFLSILVTRSRPRSVYMDVPCYMASPLQDALISRGIAVVYEYSPGEYVRYE